MNMNSCHKQPYFNGNPGLAERETKGNLHLGVKGRVIFFLWWFVSWPEKIFVYKCVRGIAEAELKLIFSENAKA